MPKHEEWKELSELQRQLYRELYKKDFHQFVKDFWECIEDRPFVDGIVVQFYCEMAQYICRQWTPTVRMVENIELPDYDPETTNIIDVRGNKKNFCVNICPRHSKSVILNIMLSCWIWLWVSIDVAAVSHNQRLAGRMNAQKQKLINSEKFKFFFPEIQLIQNTTFSLRDSRGGEMYSVPAASILGHGFDLGVVDDLTTAETAAKGMEEMNNAWNVYRNTIPSRANDVATARLINIQQRLSPLDITGRILEDPELANQYAFIVLPAIFEKDTILVFPVSGRIVRFNAGDYLWPERFGDYSGLRAQVGESVFQAEYLQHPVASDRTIVKESMINIKYINEVPNIMQADTIYASHDFPVKSTETSDFLGSVVGYKVNGMLYVKFAMEEKMDFLAQVEYVKSIDELYPGIIQVIEDKANGSPILNQLQEFVPGMQAYQPGTADKPKRMEYATMYFQNVIFVADQWDELTQKYILNEGLRHLIKQLLAFPLLQHDDVCDAFSQLVNFVFMDKRFQVYGRSFNKLNIYEKSKVQEPSYSFIFFNKEGDTWKALDIGIEYGEITKLYVKKEFYFKATIEEGIKKLKEFAPDKTVFIDASTSEALYGMFQEGVSIERYEVQDFDKSVSDLTLAFSSRKVMVENECKLLRGDIDNFKFEKSKDDNAVKYRTQKDGFIACIRVAMHFYGGIV